jgi:hypothetical protein
MISSADEALDLLRKWQQARSRVSLLLLGKDASVAATVHGNVELSESESRFFVRGEGIAAVSLEGTGTFSFVTGLDKPLADLFGTMGFPVPELLESALLMTLRDGTMACLFVGGE